MPVRRGNNTNFDICATLCSKENLCIIADDIQNVI